MKSMKNKKLSTALIAGALTATIAFGGLGTALATRRTTTPFKPAYALDSNYTIKPTDDPEAKTYYVGPEVKSGEGAGTEADPYNIAWLLSGSESPIKAGDTVLVKPGKYVQDYRIRIEDLKRTGEYNKYITVKKADETQPNPVIDFSNMVFDGNNRGVQIDTDYWYWYGIDICGAGDNGMYIGGSYNVVENCQFYNNRDTGLQIGRSYSEYNDIQDWPSYNLIKNCTSFNNYDNETYGENADGFAAKLTVGYGNIFDGCIAYRNSDDGWDLFAKVDSGNIGAVILYNCVAFENGYLAETQKEFNDKCPNFRKDLAEDNQNSYLTRDGDGNGFKLGGSIMEGDVYLYNCMSFNNRMHGVTDNSNPGVLSVKNVTAYNNSAGIDNRPTIKDGDADVANPTFGQITHSTTGLDSENPSGNINVARQTYSYNILSNIVSVVNDASLIGPDEYRGSVEYSYLDQLKGKANKFEECVDGSNRVEDYAQKGESVNSIKADIFAQLPSTWEGDSATGYTYTYNLSGLKNNTVHATYRNADGSINMGNMLRIKDYTTLFGSDHKIGADLTKATWAEYEHYSYFNASNAESKEDAAVKSAIATLDLNTNVDATFQDFDLVVKMEDVTITWTSSDDQVIAINTDTPTSASQTKDARAIVYRGAEDTQVTLTATVTHKSNPDVHMQKEFVINVKADVPTIGEVIFDGVDGGNLIVDQFAAVEEPTITVRNAADYNGKLLDESAYEVKTTVKYATEKGGAGVPIHHFTTGVAGAYEISKTIKLGDSERTQSYSIFVASTTANVQFVSAPQINVNQHGYTIAGEVSNPTGKLYALSSTQKIEGITAKQVLADGVGYDFRGESINFQFENDNSQSYYIYYVLCNARGIATTDAVEVQVKATDVTTVDQFKDMLLNNDSSTIFMLKADLDLSAETDWVTDVTSKEKSFKGVFNGLGHTIKNFTVSGTKDEYASIFYRLEGGTIENVKFDNIHITNTQMKVGIIATTYGGYVYNVAMTDVTSRGAQRVGALIGQIMNGELHVDQISLINKAAYVAPAEAPTADTFGTDIFYTLEGEEYVRQTEFSADKTYYVRRIDVYGVRTGGIVGDIQASSANNSTQTYISNCYIDATFGPVGEQFKGSIVGRFDDRNAADYLEIKYVNSVSSLYGRTYVGGIIGSSNNTGAGVTRISNCAFSGNLFYGSSVTPLTGPEKNCSGIVGRYAATADSSVKNCYAKFADHNANHEVDGDAFVLGSANRLTFWQNLFGDDGKWSFVANSEYEGQVKAPYATLNFLGDWGN